MGYLGRNIVFYIFILYNTTKYHYASTLLDSFSLPAPTPLHWLDVSRQNRKTLDDTLYHYQGTSGYCSRIYLSLEALSMVIKPFYVSLTWSTISYLVIGDNLHLTLLCYRDIIILIILWLLALLPAIVMLYTYCRYHSRSHAHNIEVGMSTHMPMEHYDWDYERKEKNCKHNVWSTKWTIKF